MRVLDLFSGIGGFSLGLERAGMETVAFCEIEEYPRKILKQHWPNVPIYEDVRELTAERLKNDGIGSVDVICGGFPCQDISVAGLQKGIEEGDRSGLWSECSRLIREIQPRYAIFENVSNLLNGQRGNWFKRVLWDISKVGYDAQWHCIPASELGAHHHRDRVWIIAYPSEIRRNPRWAKQPLQGVGELGEALLANTDKKGLEGRAEAGISGSLWSGILEQLERCANNNGGIWSSEPSVGRVVNGVPFRVDRISALGNAVVPQIPELIGKAIMEHMK